MRRQIILEIEEEGTENIVADIIGMMRDKVDMNCEFRISQKILPEKISEEKEIKIPVFFQNSCMRQQGKEMGKAICKEERGVMIHGLSNNQNVVGTCEVSGTFNDG